MSEEALVIIFSWASTKKQTNQNAIKKILKKCQTEKSKMYETE